MSTIPHEAASVTDEPLANLVLFDYPGADIILRSQNGYLFESQRPPSSITLLFSASLYDEP